MSLDRRNSLASRAQSSGLSSRRPMRGALMLLKLTRRSTLLAASFTTMQSPLTISVTMPENLSLSFVPAPKSQNAQGLVMQFLLVATCTIMECTLASKKTIELVPEQAKHPERNKLTMAMHDGCCQSCMPGADPLSDTQMIQVRCLLFGTQTLAERAHQACFY